MQLIIVIYSEGLGNSSADIASVRPKDAVLSLGKGVEQQCSALLEPDLLCVLLKMTLSVVAGMAFCIHF